MKIKEVVKILKSISKPQNYKSRGNLFWREHPDVITLIYLQSSRWGPGTYTNFGVTPLDEVVGKIPPTVGDWGWAARAEGMTVSPYREVFRVLGSGDHPESPSEHELTLALTWLLKWMDEYLGDADRVRREIQTSDSVLASIAPPRVSMITWAASPPRATKSDG